MKKQTISFVLLATGFLLGASALSALAQTWTPAPANPPSGNTPAPMNVGSAYQAKSGPLQINSGFGVLDNTFLGTSLGSDVGIGTVNPQAELSVSFNDGDMFNVFSPANNVLGLQTTLDGQPISTYGGDANNVLSLQPVVGRVGIGTTVPAAKLDVEGNIKIADGTQGAGKVLTSDANGMASWQTLVAGGVSGISKLIQGAGIVLTPSPITTTGTVAADTTYLQKRVTGTCTTGAIQTINQDGTVTCGAGGGTATSPGGTNGAVQFNNNGAFAGTANLTWDSTNNRLGIGTQQPVAALDVIGSLRYNDGNQAAGKVLTSDSNGFATWQSPATSASTPYCNTVTISPSPTNSLTVEPLSLLIGGKNICESATGCVFRVWQEPWTAGNNFDINMIVMKENTTNAADGPLGAWTASNPTGRNSFSGINGDTTKTLITSYLQGENIYDDYWPVSSGTNGFTAGSVGEDSPDEVAVTENNAYNGLVASVCVM